jgi:hypothetical protein
VVVVARLPVALQLLGKGLPVAQEQEHPTMEAVEAAVLVQ